MHVCTHTHSIGMSNFPSQNICFTQSYEPKKFIYNNEWNTPEKFLVYNKLFTVYLPLLGSGYSPHSIQCALCQWSCMVWAVRG